MMDPEAFRRAAHDMVDYILSYHESLPERRPLANVSPGYLRPLIPSEAPDEPEPWAEVLSDIERVIMPGVTHWHSPHFHAYLPTALSYPSILADMLSDAIACIGFTWLSSPACTELEMVMMDWLAKLLELPEQFKFSTTGGKGGGIIQGTASEATFIALLGARARAIKQELTKNPNISAPEIMGKLVFYTSVQAHSSAERAALLGTVEVRLVEPRGDLHSWEGESLEEAIQEDIAKGKIPFFVLATTGTTNTMAFDDLTSLGKVCEKYSLWMHVDGAYAGSACICPEYRHILNGVEYAESFNFNPHKWMMVNFDCSAMWFKDASQMTEAFNVDPVYLKHQHQGIIPDFRHWQIPLGRRFRSLKMWFVFRLIGANALREHIRKQCGLAKQFQAMVDADDRFQIVTPATLGLTTFRLKGENELNETLVQRLNANGKIHLVPAKLDGQFILRFAICGEKTSADDVKYAWQEICELAEEVLKGSTTTN